MAYGLILSTTHAKMYYILYIKGIVMRVVSFTDARKQFKAVLDGVINDADSTIITRRDAADAVVMSLDYYNSLMETVHLLKSPANAAHLAESIAQYKAGKTHVHDLIDPDTLVSDTAASDMAVSELVKPNLLKPNTSPS